MDNASGQADGCVAIGKDALRGDLTSAADGTVAIGMDALTALTIGAGNTAVGYEALLTATTEIGNTVIGYQAGKSIRHDASDNNVLIGYQACTGGTGSRNNSVAIGYQAWGNGGSANDLGGSENVFIGSLSGNGTWDTGASDGNTAVGYGTLIGAMNGAQLNVAVGKNVLRAVTTGDSNTSIGSNSGYTLSTGVRNVFLGNSAGYATVDVDRAVCIGYNAGSNGNMTSDADGTIAIGYNALLELTSGAENIAIGYQSLKALEDGSANVMIGYSAAEAANCAGFDYNIGIGAFVYNTCVGYNTGQIMTGGHSNVLLGAGSGTGITTGYQNIIIGRDTAGNVDDDYAHVIIGHSAGGVLNSGNGCVLIGKDAEVHTAAAVNEIAIGQGCTGVTNNSVTLGNASVTAVYMAQDSGATVHCGGLSVDKGATAAIAATIVGYGGYHTLVLQGDDTNTGTAQLLVDATGTGDAGVRLASATTVKWSISNDQSDTHRLEITDPSGDGVYMDQDDTSWNSASDERMKENLVELTGAVEKLKTLRCTYYNPKHLIDAPTKIGLIAQDVYEVYPEVVSGNPDDEYEYIEHQEAVEGVSEEINADHKNAMGIAYSELVPVLVKAVQELSAKVEALENA